MSNTLLPRDKVGFPIQALSLDSANVAQIAIGAASVRVALPADCDVVRIACNVSCYIKFGDVTVVAAATDSLNPVGVDLFRIAAGQTYLAAIQDGAVTGKLTITRMQ